MEPNNSNKNPFFTIVIPTMNRPEFLEATLRTALWQTFPDFEVVVSDNSNQSDMLRRNEEVIQKYSGDSRLRYVRPESWMNMPDHWEFATRQVWGTYVLVLTDRRVVRPSALQYLHSQIQSVAPGVGMAGWFDFCDYSELSGILNCGDYSGKSTLFNSKDLVKRFARFEYWKENGFWFDELPHTLNSCYRSDLAEKVRSIHGRLFRPVSPDFMAAFLMLAYNDQVLHIDRPLYIQHSGALTGNGAASFVEGMEKFTSTFPEIDPFEGTPVHLNTLFNTLVRDLLVTKKLVGDRFSDIQLDWVGYYISNYLEFIQKEQLGSGMDLVKLKSLWSEGVSKLSIEQQEEVYRLVKELESRKPRWIKLRRLVRQMGWTPIYSRLVGKKRWFSQKMVGKPVYDTIFEAATKTDNILSETPDPQ